MFQSIAQCTLRSLRSLGLLACFAFLLITTSVAHSEESGFSVSNFWSHWGDGKAEVAAYDLRHPRYGEQRKGLAVSIFVTENFSVSKGVKTDESHADTTDVVPVLKLNLVEDFPTGVYDYNLMTSVFAATEPRFGRLPGTPLKISFSSQEWCGHVYQQFRFNQSAIASESHSYFEGEEDQRVTLDYPESGIAADSLYHWARGLSAPYLAPGETRTLPLLSSLKSLRLKHLEPEWKSAQFSRSGKTSEITVPAGTFVVEVYRVEQAGGTFIEFFVEKSAPQKIIKWESSEGISAELVGVKRLEYWSLKDNNSSELLKQIGVSPRPPRTT